MTKNKNRNWKLIIVAFIIMITFGFLANLKGVIIPEIKKISLSIIVKLAYCWLLVHWE